MKQHEEFDWRAFRHHAKQAGDEFKSHMKHHGPDHRHGDWKVRRGDMQSLILKALLEKPMHGYEIIKYLEDKSHGMWRPSPGSIYPTLQMLVDQDLVAVKEIDGKKINSLTPAGKAEAERSTHSAPWEQKGFGDQGPERIMVLRHYAKPLMQNMKHIMRYGSDEHFTAAKAVLDEAVSKLTTIATSIKENPDHDESI